MNCNSCDLTTRGCVSANAKAHMKRPASLRNFEFDTNPGFFGFTSIGLESVGDLNPVFFGGNDGDFVVLSDEVRVHDGAVDVFDEGGI